MMRERHIARAAASALGAGLTAAAWLVACSCASVAGARGSPRTTDIDGLHTRVGTGSIPGSNALRERETEAPEDSVDGEFRNTTKGAARVSNADCLLPPHMWREFDPDTGGILTVGIVW